MKSYLFYVFIIAVGFVVMFKSLGEALDKEFDMQVNINRSYQGGE